MSIAFMKQFTSSKKNNVLGNICTIDGISYASDGFKTVRMNLGLKDGLKPVRGTAYNGNYPDILNVVTAFKYTPDYQVEIDYTIFMRGFKLAKVFDHDGNIFIGLDNDKLALIGKGEQGDSETVLEHTVIRNRTHRRLDSLFEIVPFNVRKSKTIKIGFYDDSPQILISGDDFDIVVMGILKGGFNTDSMPMTLQDAKNTGKRYKNTPTFMRKIPQDDKNVTTRQEIRIQQETIKTNLDKAPWVAYEVVESEYDYPVETLNLRGTRSWWSKDLK